MKRALLFAAATVLQGQGEGEVAQSPIPRPWAEIIFLMSEIAYFGYQIVVIKCKPRENLQVAPYRVGAPDVPIGAKIFPLFLDVISEYL